MKRDSGYYWVRFKQEDWQVACYDNKYLEGTWQFIGDDLTYKEIEFPNPIEVGSRIVEPTDAR